MSKLIGVVFLLLSVWQFWISKRSLKEVKQNGNKSTSPFMLVSLASSMGIAIVFLVVAFMCFTMDFSTFAQ